MPKWLKMGGGHLVAFPLLVFGGYAGVFAVTILLDVLVRTAGVQADGLFIGVFILGMAAVGVGLGGWMLRYLWMRVWPNVAPHTDTSGSTTLHNIREGYAVDYDLRTWTVTEHKQYPYEGWPTDVWTLRDDGEERVLEYGGNKTGTFRLFERASVSDVTVDGEPFAKAVGAGAYRHKGAPNRDAPGTIEYADTEDTQYVLSEEDARVHEVAGIREGNEHPINFLVRSSNNSRIMGLFGGIAEYLGVSSFPVRLGAVVGILALVIGGGSVAGFGVGCCTTVFAIGGYFGSAYTIPEPPPERFSSYWIYESEEDTLVTIQRADGYWTARFGQVVEPYEFDNVLPSGEA